MSLPHFDDHAGVRRYLGSRPAPPGRYRLAAPTADADLIPEAEWSAVSDRYVADMPVYDQGRLGACNAFASVECLEVARRLAGDGYTRLSAGYLYGTLTGGRDVGSNPEEALQLLATTGTPREDLCPYPTISPRRFSAAATADAANYRVEIGDALATRAALVTAILRREPCDITMCVGAGYDDLDADGCVRVGLGWDNHALSTDGRLWRSKDGRRWCVGFRNHWTAKWGDGGFAGVHLDDLIRNGSWSGYTIRAPKANPTDNPPPVPA